ALQRAGEIAQDGVAVAVEQIAEAGRLLRLAQSGLTQSRLTKERAEQPAAEGLGKNASHGVTSLYNKECIHHRADVGSADPRFDSEQFRPAAGLPVAAVAGSMGRKSAGSPMSQIKRREFIASLGAAMVARAVPARAQQPERLRTIGVMGPGTEADPQSQDRVG